MNNNKMMINNNNTVKDIKARLTSLEELKALLTPEEYSHKRADIIASIGTTGVNNKDAAHNSVYEGKGERVIIATATLVEEEEPSDFPAFTPISYPSSSPIPPTTVNVILPQSPPIVVAAGSTAVYAAATAGGMTTGTKTTKILLGSSAHLSLTVQTLLWEGFSIKAGQDVILWPNSATSNNHQQWLYNPVNKTIAVASQPNLCLTAVGGPVLKIMPRISLGGGLLPQNPSQQWTINFANGTIHLAIDPTTVISVATVTPYVPSFHQGQKVILWKSIGPALSQKWLAN